MGVNVYTGSCLCGGIQFRIASEIAPIEICHCQQCRKAQGGAFATNSPIKSDAFELIRGGDLLAQFESSPGKQRVFCKRCASPIFSSRTAVPGVLRIRVGLIDGTVAARLSAHAHVASQCNWWPITDSLPQFAEAYEAPPASGR
jgi:hypothetical protein